MFKGMEESMSGKTMNKELLVLQQEWLSVCDADGMAGKYSLSRPFSFAVTEQYMRRKRKTSVVMKVTGRYRISSNSTNAM